MQAMTGLSGLSGIVGSAAQVLSETRSVGAAVSTGPGGVAWGIASRALTSNDSYTTSALNAFQTTQWLDCTDFAFTEVSGTVVGYEVKIERSQVSTGGNIAMASVLLRHGGADAGNEKTPGTSFPASDAVETVGNSSDLWGATLTAAQVKESTFGCRIGAEESGGGSSTARIDHVQMTVYYTP